MNFLSLETAQIGGSIIGNKFNSGNIITESHPEAESFSRNSDPGKIYFKILKLPQNLVSYEYPLTIQKANSELDKLGMVASCQGQGLWHWRRCSKSCMLGSATLFQAVVQTLSTAAIPSSVKWA